MFSFGSYHMTAKTVENTYRHVDGSSNTVLRGLCCLVDVEKGGVLLARAEVTILSGDLALTNGSLRSSGAYQMNGLWLFVICKLQVKKLPRFVRA